ncbi:MAG: prephenate dehydratase domain-containing protein, partial [Alphaproteobacteria bacterium]
MTASDIDQDGKTGAGGSIAFQGLPGAYSDLACRQVHGELTPLACQTFDEVFAAVEDGAAARAMIPIENSVAGRV